MQPVFRDAIDSISFPILFLDGAGVCVYFNRSAEALVQQLGLGDLLGKVVTMTLLDQPPVLNVAGAPTRLVFQSGAAYSAQIEILTFADDLLALIIHAGLDTDSDRAATLHTSSDAEPLDLHMQRLETLGILAGGIAHDFNNMLTGILGHVSYLKSILPRTGAHVESIDSIEQGAKKSAQITRQILTFAKQEVEEPTCIGLAEAIESTCKLLRGALSPMFTLKMDICNEVCDIVATEGLVSQVVVNLVMNARDALGDRGTISVGLSTRCADRPDSDGFAVLSVSDRGCGIPGHIRGQIFKPFFTTKAGSGLGLGLSTVSSIVTQLEGRIEVDSVEGEGTTVTILLPRVEPLASPLISRHADEETFGLLSSTSASSDEREGLHDRTVLVVDDEELVRNVLAMSLRHLGYGVAITSSGEEALGLLDERAAPFLLAVVDMVMPSVGGDLVVRDMRQRFPSMPIVMISGMCPPDVVDELLTYPATYFLRKPFTIRDLASTLERVLA